MDERIAIVGGGIAGMYCAHILAMRGKKVDLFEASERLGGRIRTIRLNKDCQSIDKSWAREELEFYAEFGPMRVELDSQVLLKGLLNHLGIKEKRELELESNRDSFAKCATALRRAKKELAEQNKAEANKFLNQARDALSDEAKNAVESALNFLDNEKFEEAEKAIAEAETTLGYNEAHLVDFPSYSSPSSENDPQYKLRPEEEGKDPLELLEMALLRIVLHIQGCDDNNFSKIQRELKNNITLAAATNEQTKGLFIKWTKDLEHKHYWDIQTNGTIDNVPLYAMGFWNLLSDYLSHNAILKMHELGSFYHLLDENPNAAEWLIWWLRGVSISDHLRGISGGMETIIERLERKLRGPFSGVDGDVRIWENAEVIGLEEESGKNLKIVLSETFKESHGDPPEECYRHVILALPRKALERVVGYSRFEIKGLEDGEDQPTGSKEFLQKRSKEFLLKLLQSTFGFPMTKVFAVIRNRWWEQENLSNQFAAMVPTREFHYWMGRTSGSRQGLIMAYADRPAATFWANYVNTLPQIDVDHSGKTDHPEEMEEWEKASWDRLKKKLVQYINKISGNSKITDKDLIWCGIRDWGREPYYGANHAWRQGRKYWIVMSELADVKLESGSHIHVCGEAYSDYHGFIEGALRSSVYALHHIINEKNEAYVKPKKFLESVTDLTDKDQLKYVVELSSWITDLEKEKEKAAVGNRTRDRYFFYDWKHDFKEKRSKNEERRSENENEGRGLRDE